MRDISDGVKFDTKPGTNGAVGGPEGDTIVRLSVRVTGVATETDPLSLYS